MKTSVPRKLTVTLLPPAEQRFSIVSDSDGLSTALYRDDLTTLLGYNAVGKMLALLKLDNQPIPITIQTTLVSLEAEKPL